MVDSEADIERIARATIDALVDVCGIPLDVVDADLWAPRRRRPVEAATFTTPVGHDDLVVDPGGLELDYGAFALARREQVKETWPWGSEIEAAFFAIVDEQSVLDVLELVALAPTGPGEVQVGWFRRSVRGWVADPTVARRLSSSRPERLRTIPADTARQVEPTLAF